MIVIFILGKRGRAKKITTVKQENKSNTEEKVKRPYKPRQKKGDLFFISHQNYF